MPVQQTLLTSFLFASLLSSSQATSLEEVQRISHSGAVSLALRVIELEQDAQRDKPDIWMQWEQERVRLNVQKREWRKVAKRLESIPKFASADFIQWARMQRAEALIALGEGELARTELRSLIWSVQDSAETESVMNQWRRLVIQSYLTDGLAEDAQTAALRYRQEYGEQQQDLLLRARIAILNNQSEEAIGLLKPHAEQPRAGALLLLAQLRGKTRSGDKVMQAALRHLRKKEIDDELRINLWAVASEAAQRAGQRVLSTNAFEHILAEKDLLTLPKAIIDVQSDALWNAYIEYALQIGNHNHLLIGQDDKWLAHADSIKKKTPVGARAMCAFVMLRGQAAEMRQQASNDFVELMSKRKHGKKLLHTLFTGSHFYPRQDTIPEPVKHVLVDLAIAESDIARASEIMATIQQPPPGSDQFMWQLRRARVLVLGTQVKQGISGLNNLLATQKMLEPLQLDRFMQVLFDLQTVGEHEAAYQLFEKVMTQTEDQKIQREIYFWMADSRKAQEQYDKAARLYLKSAMYPDPGNMDPWAQTAHYQAADALAKAGMYGDAQNLFEHLLKVTEEPSRRAVLERELQKLAAKH